MKYLILSSFFAFTLCGQSIDYAQGIKNKPILSVKDAPYYAKGDGTTDATTALQSAFTAAQSINGVVDFEAGKTYLVKATHAGFSNDLVAFTITGSLTISCHGSIIQLFSVGTHAAPKDMFYLNGAGNVTFRDCYFKGQSVAASGTGGDLIDRLIFTKDSGPLTVDNCIFEKTNVGIQNQGDTTGVYAGNGLKVLHSKFRNIIGSSTNSTGYGVLSTQGATDCLIDGNDFNGLDYPTNTTSVMRHATYISSGSTCTIVNNDVADVLLAGINAFYGSTPGAYPLAKGYIIKGNRILRTPSIDWVYTGGIDVNGYFDGTIIQGNTIADNQGNGISVSSMDGAVDSAGAAHFTNGNISDNIIRNTKYSGILPQGPLNTKISGNLITNFGVSVGDCIKKTDTVIGGATPVVNANLGLDISSNYCFGSTGNFGVDDVSSEVGIAWSSGTTYAAPATGATYLAIGSNNRTYSSKAGSNLNHNPVTDTAHVYWNDAMTYVHDNILVGGPSGPISDGFGRIVRWNNYPDGIANKYTPAFNTGLGTSQISSLGTAITSTDFSDPSATNWGSTAGIYNVTTGSRDSFGEVNVRSLGTGQTLFPTLVFTFHDVHTGTPFCSAHRDDGVVIATSTHTGIISVGTTTSTYTTFRLEDTPVASSIYSIMWDCRWY